MAFFYTLMINRTISDRMIITLLQQMSYEYDEYSIPRNVSYVIIEYHLL